MRPSRQSIRNLLLQAIPPDGLAMLLPLLEPIVWRKGEPVHEANETTPWAAFPETGIVSIVNRTPGGRNIEVGIVGFDGMAGLPLVLGTGQMPYRAFVQIEGAAHRVPAEAFLDVMDRVDGIRELLLRYVQAFMVQIAETALSNGSYTIEERLARWLLLVHNRSASDELSLTHEFLAIMLGVRRTGVTLAVHVLEGGGMIRARRGLIVITDRAKLMTVAGDGYGVAEAEYARLIGTVLTGPIEELALQH